MAQHAGEMVEQQDDVQGFILPLILGAVVVVVLASGCGDEPKGNDRFKSDGYPSSARRG